MKKQGKKYVEASEKVDKNKSYNLDEAIKLMKETSFSKFDGTVEMAFNLNIDPKKSDQQIRGSVTLPNGTGRTRKVLAIVSEEHVENVKAAKADHVGGKDLLEKIQKENWLDFDIIVTTPDMMVELGKLGTILGPKGLMPNPKTGTISATPEKVVKEIKHGMLTFKNDAQGNIHTIVGKTSFDDKLLIGNIKEMYNTIIRMKPNMIKGNYIKNITLCSSMSPGIKLDLSSFDK